MAFRIYKNIKHHSDKFDEKVSKKYKIYMYTIIILSIIGIIDNGIYYMDYYNNSYLTFITLEYRTLSFDVIKLLICIIGIIKIYNSFENLFAMKDKGEKSKTKKLNDCCIDYSLTTRQREIVGLIIEGYTNKEIGEQLHITEGTVKIHIYNIFKKTEVTNRNKLIKKVMED